MKIRNMTLLFIISYILFSPIPAWCYSYSAGIKIGVNIASWHGKDADDLDNEILAMGGDVKAKIGMCGGGILEFYLGKLFYIQPGLFFTSKGKRYHTEQENIEDNDTIYFENNSTYKATYLEIPVLLKVSIPISEKVRPYFYTGPSLSVLLSLKLEQNYKQIWNGNINKGTNTQDFTNDYAKVDIGLSFGGGLSIKVGPGSIVTEVIYTHGFLEILDYKHSIIEEPSEIKNLAFSIMTGYFFDF